MSSDIKNKLKKKRTVSYLNKDFDGFRSDLLSYARTFFPDQIQDFSEASVGGLFIDMASYVGDVMSFYLDHQFGELDVGSAVERQNIERHVRMAGVEPAGAAPAVATVDFIIAAPAVYSDGEYIPNRSALPVIAKNTIVSSAGGVSFVLVEDIDFSEQNKFDELKATLEIKRINSSGIPTQFTLTRSGLCVSGKVIEQKLRLGNSFVPFRKVSLSSRDVSSIMSVYDSEGNRYYEVTSLTQDTVFKPVINLGNDSDLVPENLELVPAPYRYTRQISLKTGLTTLQFGSGLAESLDGDVLPDPSALALPLYGKKTFSRFSIDPNSLLKTKTMGISPYKTTLTVVYRSGGGLNHNVAPRQIRNVEKLIIKFHHNPDVRDAAIVRASLRVNNNQAAAGGAPALTLDELKAAVPAYRNSQARIVTKQDLLARIYTMPSNFGRVFRAGIRSNPNNPLATQLFIISQDARGKLAISPDALKENLSLFLNEYRLVSDAVDILDAKVINLSVKVEVLIDSMQNTASVANVIQAKVAEYFKIKYAQIDKPLVTSEVLNIVINVPGVVSLVNIEFFSVTGVVMGRKYSTVSFNVKGNSKKGVIFPPTGAIFEMRHPKDDIVVIAG